MKVRIKNPIYGVPQSFFDKYNPEQFEIIYPYHPNSNFSYINSRKLYVRILIKKK